jgi:hypothetical protein
MPAAIWFEDVSGKRYDQIQFFADGTFESSKQWTYTNSSGTQVTETLSGNTARVYYGHVNNVKIVKSTSWQRTPDATRYYNSTYFTDRNTPNFYRERGTKAILARRAHLSVQLSSLATFPDPTNFSSGATAFVPWLAVVNNAYGNDRFEYDNISLTEWTNILANPVNATQYLDTCFANPTGTNPTGGRPGIDLTASDGESLHMVMVQGIGSFSIQLAYMSGGVLYWWPSPDPNGDGNTSDSDFGTTKMNATAFGYYMNFPIAPSSPDWKPTVPYLSLLTTSNSYPQAIKFTFTLYDSNGVFKDGKTFTHIVYLN